MHSLVEDHGATRTVNVPDVMGRDQKFYCMNYVTTPRTRLLLSRETT